MLYFLPLTVSSQTVYQHVSDRAIYEFLDELATEGVIEINSAVLPFSRTFIAEKLVGADSARPDLNPRQQKELDFYLRDYARDIRYVHGVKKSFDVFYYRDSLFSISADLILGYQYWSNGNGNVHHRRNGGEVRSYVGSHWGFYASLRDNHESEPISDAPYLTRRMGANYKAAYDYSEMRGGVTYSWDWGVAGIIKDHNIWGSNYHGSNIQSGRTPSFAKIMLTLKPVRWFEFNYFHGWLVSGIVDSSRSYWTTNYQGATFRNVYHPKYMAANIFTFHPVGKLSVSAGNSIIYTDLGVHPAYLIPIFFYKSVDHTLNAGIENQNSQMFLDISSYNIRKLHLYGSFFIDELAISRITDPAEQSNFWSWKLGGRVSDLAVDNLYLTFEYTGSNPRAFRHPTPELTYTSNGYNLGHYLLDNAVEYYIEAGYRPAANLLVRASYTLARKGPDYTSGPNYPLGLPYMTEVDWEDSDFNLLVRYQVINDLFVFAGYEKSNISGDATKYTHPLWQGNTSTLTAGMNFGF